MELKDRDVEEMVFIGSRLVKYRRLREQRIQKFTSLSILKDRNISLSVIKQRLSAIRKWLSLSKAELFGADKESKVKL